MTMQRFFLVFLVALSLSLSAQGRIFAAIDTFQTFSPGVLSFEVEVNDPSNVWYSPYGDASTAPVVLYQDTTDALGGQRDLICGHYSTSDPGSSANISIQSHPTDGRLLISISLGYLGTCYVQWDGMDNVGTDPFPGAILNASPGIGSGGNPYGRADGSMDFTFGGFATAITSTVITDHSAEYGYTVLDTAGEINELIFVPSDQEAEFNFAAYFDSTRWTNPNFDWTNVVAFQVRATALVVGGTSSAIDTNFRFFRIIGYEVVGDVVVDCGCTGTPTTFTEGATVSLSDVTNNLPNIATDITDPNGAWSFTNLKDGVYRVCLTSGAALCASSPQCQEFELAGFIDPPAMRFSTNIPTTLNSPPDETLICGDCITPDCLGIAIETGCNGEVQLVPTVQDNNDPCNRVIIRTWTTTDGTITRTQTVTVRDGSAPTLIDGAANGQSDCGSAAGPTINDWLANNGGATVEDCSPYTWSNDFNTAPTCGPVTVVFTATDVCGFATRTTATWTIIDNTPPVFQTQPTAQTANCDTSGTSVQDAYTQWLNTFGGATATDTCTDVTISHNGPANVANTCGTPLEVTFTARDSCGNTVPATATFTVVDNQLPVIDPQASATTVECSAGGIQTALQTWINSRGGAQATDNCVTSANQLTWSNDWDGVTLPQSCGGGLPVTFTVTDPCNNAARTTATFSVTDSAPPTITRPASPASAQCDQGGGAVPNAFAEWIGNNGGAQAADACSSFTWSNSGGQAPEGGCDGSGVDVTFIATDDCNGLSVETTASFSVIDTAPPSFVTPPSDTTVDCGTGTVQQSYDSWLASFAGATASDNCGTPTIEHNGPASPNVGCNTPTPVEFTAVDLCGLRSPALRANFIVTDTTGPQLTTPATPLALQCDGTNQQSYQEWLNMNGNAAAVDDCGEVTWANDGPASLTFACSTNQQVTFTARDPCGQTVTTTATVTVNDSVPPTITTPASDSTVECSATAESGFQQWLSTRGGAQATDNCGSVTWSNDWNEANWQTSPNGCERTAPVNFIVADQCGNQLSTAARYIIVNTEAPSITTPARPLSVECDGSTGQARFDEWIATHGGAQAADACTPSELLQWSNSGTQSPDACSQAEVTFTVTDPCGGSAATTATFSLGDTTRPTFTVQPVDPRVECDGSGNVAQYQQWVASNAGAEASDSCSFFVNLSIDAPATGPVGCGSTPATVTAEDECGNTATVPASFTVVDTTAPTFAPPASNQQVECAAENESQLQAWLASNGGAQAVDICSPVENLQWSNNYRALSGAGCGQNAEVEFSVVDGCGQRAVTTATFSISDSTPPTLTTPAEDAVFECRSSGNSAEISSWVASNGGAQATDSCSGVSWSNDFTEPPAPCGAPLLVTFTAADACGNLVSTSARVSVVDTLVPEFTNFPPDLTLYCNDPTDSSATGVPGSTDQCDTEVDISENDVVLVNPPERFCPGDTIITRTWTLVDNCGNVNTRDQVIVITLRTGPCLPQPCPPCENEPECCASSMEPLPCNPVPCNPVPCRGSVGCEPVACTPVECDCEPIYIYVFDDDDATSFETSFNAASGASKNVFSVLLMVAVLALALLI